MSKSLWEIHQEWVEELLRRGEKILQPERGNPHGSVWGYVKTQIPHKDAGNIFKREDGTFEILCDMCQYGVTGLKLEEIGLCDAKCWYEWMDKDKCETEQCYKDNLNKISTKDLVEELLTRERIKSITVSHGRKFPDLSHDEWNIRTGPAKIIIIETLNRKDGYK